MMKLLTWTAHAVGWLLFSLGVATGVVVCGF